MPTMLPQSQDEISPQCTLHHVHPQNLVILQFSLFFLLLCPVTMFYHLFLHHEGWLVLPIPESK